MKYGKTISATVAAVLTFLATIGFDVDQTLILSALQNLLAAFGAAV